MLWWRPHWPDSERSQWQGGHRPLGGTRAITAVVSVFFAVSQGLAAEALGALEEGQRPGSLPLRSLLHEDPFEI